MKIQDAQLDLHQVIEIPCAHLFFTKNVVIVEVKQDELIGKDQIIMIVEAITSVHPNLSTLHYISNRVHTYSLKPTEYVQIRSRIDSFKSYAVVTYDNTGMTNLVFERLFLKKDITRYESIRIALKAAQLVDHQKDNSVA